MRWCSSKSFIFAEELHKNCAICASPTQRERFHFAGSLFHTLFNRTVENFHTTFTFTFIFCLSLVRKLLCGFFFLGFARRKFFFIYFQPVVRAPTEFVSFARAMIRFCNA